MITLRILFILIVCGIFIYDFKSALYKVLNKGCPRCIEDECDHGLFSLITLIIGLLLGIAYLCYLSKTYLP